MDLKDFIEKFAEQFEETDANNFTAETSLTYRLISNCDGRRRV